MEILRTFFDLLTPREKRNLGLLFVAVVIMAGLEVVSVASIMPFLSVAADPASVQENAYLSWVYETLGFTDTNSFLIALGLAALVAMVVSNTFIILTTWALFRYAWGRNHTLSYRLLKSYLQRPYEYFLTRNSSELGKNILEEVKEVVNEMLIHVLRGGAKAIVALFIMGFLVFIDPTVAFIVALVLGAAYAGIYLAVKDRIDVYGQKRVALNSKRYQVVSEAFGGIKEVKLAGKEQAFLDQYEFPSKWYSRFQARYRVIGLAPRYLLEIVAFGGIILIAVYLIAVQDSVQQVIPMLGLYAFAGYRLMPALQQAFKGVASARFNLSALEAVRQGLIENASPALTESQNGLVSKPKARPTLDLKSRLILNDVSFAYPDAEEPAIKNLSLEISAHTTVGFVGKTGSGKTTAVDLILGLLRPQKGTISVDSVSLNEGNLRSWQQNIGYVPQHIYLSDDTVAHNIAFGVPEDEIDIGAVQDAARRARIFDFVDSELPNEWDTLVGERGVKLSGGQQQRIGIARALYHNPSVLVFDEATSALDQATEASVMEAIYELEGEHTMVMIAHRLSTVKRADNIIMLEQGRKVGEGSYDELSDRNSRFREMAFS